MWWPEMVTVDDQAVRPPRRSDTMLKTGGRSWVRRQCSVGSPRGGLVSVVEVRGVFGQGEGVPWSLSCQVDDRRLEGDSGDIGDDIVEECRVLGFGMMVW